LVAITQSSLSAAETVTIKAFYCASFGRLSTHVLYLKFI